MLAFVSFHMIGHRGRREEGSVFVTESVLGIIFYKIIPARSGIVGGRTGMARSHIKAVPGEEMSHITMFTVNIKSKCCIN